MKRQVALFQEGAGAGRMAGAGVLGAHHGGWHPDRSLGLDEEFQGEGWIRALHPGKNRG